MEEEAYQIPLPKWIEYLPITCRPWKRETINKLEDVLEEIKEDTNNFFSEDAFSLAIANSYATSKRVQIFIYHEFLGKFPNLEKKEILRYVLSSRIESRVFNPDPEGRKVYDRMNLDEAMKKINSLKDLCDFIGEQEKSATYSTLPDLFRIVEFRKKIDDVLNEEIEAYFQGNLCPKFQRIEINPVNLLNSFKFTKKVFDYFANVDPNIPTWLVIQSLIQAQFPQISSDVAYLIALKYGQSLDHLCCFLYWGIGKEEYGYKQKNELLEDKKILELLNNSHIEGKGMFLRLVRDKEI